MPHIVRRVLPTEYSKYRTHLKALDKPSRYLRFCCPATDEFIDRICDHIEEDKDNHILFCIEDENLNFVGIGHLSLEGGMELAFSVLPEHQHKGMGDALLRRCTHYCRTHGILSGCMMCLPTNSAMRHLCIKHGIHIHTEDGETLADIDFNKPNLMTYIDEGININLAVADYLSKRAHNLWTFLPDKPVVI